jgi:integrase
MPKRIPKLCHHRGTNRAYVNDPITKKEIYFGTWGSPEAEREYGHWVQQFLSPQVPELKHTAGMTVEGLLVLYLDHATVYYRKHGHETSEVDCLRLVAKHLRAECGDVALSEFTPRNLKQVRGAMVAAGYTRGSINHHVHRVRRIFRWGVEHELVSPAVLHALEAVASLAIGRSEAPESQPVRPVDMYAVEKTIVRLPPVLADMVRVQLAAGMRPQEICVMRPCDLDRNSEPWRYVPSIHKTEHHGKAKQIWLGPRARETIAPRLAIDPMAWLFPLARRSGRGRSLGRYTTRSYYAAITRACRKAGVPAWSPNQLRHSAGTSIREAYGLEGAQAILDHERASTTQIYAERNQALARKIAEDMG